MTQTDEKANEESNEIPLDLEDYIKIIVEKVIEQRELNLAVDDIKLIVKELMPDLDKLIAEKVKQHFHAMGLMLMENFKAEE